MKQETEKLLDEQRRIVAYLESLSPDGDLRQAKVNALPARAFGRLQSPAVRFCGESIGHGETGDKLFGRGGRIYARL